jgi:hypothetical protein
MKKCKDVSKVLYHSVFQYHVDNLFPLIWDGFLAIERVAHCSNLLKMMCIFGVHDKSVMQGSFHTVSERKL